MKNSWKYPSLLLVSTGIAGIGDFVYLVSINIIVFQITGSAAAVAGLWAIGPIVNMATKFWTGSFIDYRSKKRIIISTYLLRTLFIVMLPFASNLFIIYAILVLISLAKSFFQPALVTYITLSVLPEMRKKFNSIRAFVSSSAFIIGPAIGGSLILLTNINLTLWLNGVFFIIALFIFSFLPKNEEIDRNAIPKFTISHVKKDFSVVLLFIKNNKYIAFIYISFLLVMLFSFAMDTQEVVFTQAVIGLSELDYSLLISITGIGALVGGFILALISNILSIKKMIIIGLIMMTSGYIMYAFSWSFLTITIGFTVLGFFNVFLNAGIMTFYQNNIPLEIMGRVTSIFQLIESMLQVGFILLIGMVADWYSLRITIASLSIMMLICSIIFTLALLRRDKEYVYE